MIGKIFVFLNVAIITLLGNRLFAAEPSKSGKVPYIISRHFPVNRTVYCLPTTTPPVIDGVLNDACWKRAARLENLVTVQSGGSSAEKNIGYIKGGVFEYSQWSCTLGGFHTPDLFGYLIFTPAPPCGFAGASLTSIKGKKFIKASLMNRSDESKALSVEAVISAPSGTSSMSSSRIELPSKKSGEVNLKYELTQAGRHKLVLKACNAKTGKVYDKVRYLLDVDVPLQIRIDQKEYFISDKVAKMTITVNEKELNRVAVCISLRKTGTGKELYSKKLRPTERIFSYHLPIQKLAAGKYEVVVELLKDGNLVTSCRCPFARIKDLFDDF